MIIQINKTIQTPEGVITFEGSLTQEEANLVLEVGLGFLFQQGALSMGDEDDSQMEFPFDTGDDVH